MLRAARARALVCLALVLVPLAGCQRGLGRQYEYEEQLYLELDGAATVVVNASIPALIALRGLKLDPNPDTRIDRNDVREAFASAGIRITRVSRPWRRAGRRFVQVRFEVDDVNGLGRVAPLAWSKYSYAQQDGQVVYTQRVGESVNTPPPGVNWDGSELVAFRFHMPSRINYHNAPGREVERGNILSFEQTLAERLNGRPIEVEVRMDARSIFRRTMTVFLSAVVAALLLLGAAVWWVLRKGRAAAGTA
jgi:hypothetical protein